MSKDECTVERVLNDVKNHKINIINDISGTGFRHINFRNPGTSDCWFDIITWKGSLCINGDHGSYVFMRIDNMLTFFRSKKDELGINPGYWAQKCVSQGLYGDGIKNFSVDKFRKNVEEDFKSHFEDSDDKEAMAEAREDVDSQLMHCEDEWECVVAMRDFESKKISFEDFFESSCNEYSFHYIWCLYAIVWGIRQYDLARAANEANRNRNPETI